MIISGMMPIVINPVVGVSWHNKLRPFCNWKTKFKERTSKKSKEQQFVNPL